MKSGSSHPDVREKLFILDQHRKALVHREISTETMITITGFLGAVLLLLGGVVFR